MENKETVTITKITNGYQLIVQHDQSGSAYGCNLSEFAYQQLRLHFVNCSLQPLTINNVSKMLDKVSKETWVATTGDEHGWKEWWKNRNKLYLNSNER